MLSFHYLRAKLQAVKPVTDHTRGLVRANRNSPPKPEASRDAAEELSPLASQAEQTPPEVNTGLTSRLPFLAEETSVSAAPASRMRAGHALKRAGPQQQELQQPL